MTRSTFKTVVVDDLVAVVIILEVSVSVLPLMAAIPGDEVPRRRK